MNIVEELTPSINALGEYARELEDDKLSTLLYKLQEQIVLLDLES